MQAAREGRRGGRAGRRRRGAPRAPPLNTEPSASRSSGATFVALFVAALTILFIVRVVEVLVLVFIAVLCAVYLSAITDLLERRFRLARPLGLTAAVLATLAGVAGIGAIILSPVVEQTQALISGLPQTLTNIQNVIAAWASEYPFLRNTELANPASGLVAGLINDATMFLRGFFFPEEDGIRDTSVTGVQTCALPIWCMEPRSPSGIPGPSSLADFPKGIAVPYTPEELVRIFEQKPLAFTPGKQFQYSNPGYYTLGDRKSDG